MDKFRVPVNAGQGSPVVDRSFNYQRSLIPPKKSLLRGVINLIFAFFLFFEVTFNLFQIWLGIRNNILNSCLFVFAVIFAVNSFLNFFQAANTSITAHSLPLSPMQKKLMGIVNNTAYQSTPVLRTSSSQSLVNSSSPRAFNLSSFSNQSNSPSSYAHHSESPSYFETSQGSNGMNLHSSYINNKASPYFHNSSFLDSSGESMMLHHRKSPFLNSPLPEEEFMTDQKTLNSYLKSYFEIANKTKSRFVNDFSPAQAWGHSYYDCDNNIDLSKTIYQLSTRSPKSPTESATRKDDAAAAKLAASEYWVHSDVSNDTLRKWMAKLRRWLALVLLRGLIKKIDEMNKLLKQCGYVEVQVGESSLSALKQLQVNIQCQSGLAYLLPYLEISSNQEYLVNRIRRLAGGGYMSDFQWNIGGNVKDHNDWGDDLVTDSELIIHLFCVYMDNHLPPDPRFPNGKSFSTQYFIKTPTKPKAEKLSDRMVIYQSHLRPPHFLVVTKDMSYDLPPGRHNMLTSLLLFLHHLKTKKSSMLGPVNLGLIGIDVLYVLDDEESIEIAN